MTLKIKRLKKIIFLLVTNKMKNNNQLLKDQMTQSQFK